MQRLDSSIDIDWNKFVKKIRRPLERLIVSDFHEHILKKYVFIWSEVMNIVYEKERF